MSTTTNQTPFHQRHDEELLTLAEVAEILKSPENTLRWWRQIGSGPAFFKIGRRSSPPLATCASTSASSGSPRGQSSRSTRRH